MYTVSCCQLRFVTCYNVNYLSADVSLGVLWWGGYKIGNEEIGNEKWKWKWKRGNEHSARARQAHWHGYERVDLVQ